MDLRAKGLWITHDVVFQHRSRIWRLPANLEQYASSFTVFPREGVGPDARAGGNGSYPSLVKWRGSIRCAGTERDDDV